MIEVTGDATRGDEWACVRLVVDGERIVEADADGLERSLVGLTLLEAAAVPGERLAASTRSRTRSVPIFQAGADPARVAVAMSGGVDSAVALLRAGPAAIGVTLRLWIDPEAPDVGARLLLARGRDRRARDLSRARHSARHARRARGFSARDRGSRSSRATRAARRRIRARAATAAFASRSSWRSRAAPGLRRLATGHYARIVDTAAGVLLARAADERKDQSYMLARLDPRRLERIWFPLGEQTQGGDAARGRARRPAGRPAGREPGGVLPGRRRLPRVPRAARPARP